MQESCNWITNWVATPALSTEEGSDKQSELFHNPYFRNQLRYFQNRLHTYFKTMFNLICLFSKPSLPTTFVGGVVFRDLNCRQSLSGGFPHLFWNNFKPLSNLSVNWLETYLSDTEVRSTSLKNLVCPQSSTTNSHLHLFSPPPPTTIGRAFRSLYLY